MQELLYFFGHGFCHQLTSRTFEVDGLYFSACARDTGIYLGLVFTVLAILLLYRRRPFRPSALPPLPVVLATVALGMSLIVDGVTSYVGLRETDNLIRYATGIGAGSAIGVFASCAVIELVSSFDDTARVLARPREALAVWAAVALAAAAFYLGYPYLGVVGPLAALAAFIAIILGVNLLVLGLTRRLDPRLQCQAGLVGSGNSGSGNSGGGGGVVRVVAVSRWARAIGLAAAMGLFEIALLGGVRELVLGTLLGIDSLDALFH
ncbi:MAG: DUF2085 domain-containing protein [Coriobacteriales bacterium]|jgi:uncharacterized membrane protein|nr:DUF2085 domain-containing protein [Coriobacteriales bacterium]